MADPAAPPPYVEKIVTDTMIEGAQQARIALGESVIPFGINKGRAIKDLTQKDLWELSEFTVRGDRDEYCITAPTRQFCKDFGFIKWVVHHHYPLAIIARRYRYELRDLLFRKALQIMKAINPDASNCAKCRQPLEEAQPSRMSWDHCFHYKCWRGMLEQEVVDACLPEANDRKRSHSAACGEEGDHTGEA
jgi:hypothetical protein